VVEAERNLNATTFQLLAALGVFNSEGIDLPVESYDHAQNFEAVKYQGMTAVTDRYVPEFVQDAIEEIKGIPVAPSVVETLNSSIISDKDRPDMISPKN